MYTICISVFCLDNAASNSIQYQTNDLNMKRNYIAFFALTFVLVFSGHSNADVSLASPFGDNMVLQRGVEVPIWGWTDPGDEVHVIVKGQHLKTKGDENGSWMVRLEPMQVGEPFAIRVVGSHNEINLTNVVVGEVWICSGQSNMEWTVARSADPESEIAAGDFPDIRHIKMNHTIKMAPQLNCPNTGWKVCSPETVGDFTAVGYYFGRKLHRDLKVPIGLINTSWGGTIVEAWTSGDSLKSHPDFTERIASIVKEESNLEQAAKEFEAELKVWQEKRNEAVEASRESAGPIDDSSWKQLNAPGVWERQGFRRFDGVAWYRKSIDIPEAWVGKELSLSLAKIDDNDRTYVNGKLVGETEGWTKARKYEIPAAVNDSAKMTIAVQVIDEQGNGGIHGEPEEMSVAHADQKPISLAGKWRFATVDALNDLPPQPKRPGFHRPNNPTALYNGMVHPLIPFAFKGAIWYQGESNAGRAYQYRTLFPLLIKDWRGKWGSEFPFYWVQLANFQAVKNEPAPSNWAELREAQSRTLSLPNTGEAVIIDIGDARNIHPKNKQDVGKRLALLALNHDYNVDVHYSGPRYREMKVEGDKVRLQFDFADGLVSTDGEELKRFEIAGEDQKFVWADATIDGDTVVVSSAEIAQPVAVRYAWAHNPEGCNLTNSSGLPASPFRTDDWPGVTIDKK